MYTACRPGSALLAGTPCDSLKNLLEPFSVPLLGNNKEDEEEEKEGNEKEEENEEDDK